MAKLPRLFLAKFEQVLLYADGPQIVLLSAPGGLSKLIGIAINLDGATYPFFAAQASNEQFQDYLHERFDLRYLLMKPDLRRHYIFDLADETDGAVPVSRHKFELERDETFLPEAGLFARDHTEPVVVELGEFQATQTFGIDGKWDLPEFSRFYGQVTDLYSLFNSVDLFLNDQANFEQQNRVRLAFVKPFQGGGSYVSLYDSLDSASPRANRLSVEGIAYNSPGYVRVSGRQKPLAEVRSLLEHVEANMSSLAEHYRALDRFLSEAKLKRLPANRFSRSTPGATAVYDLTKALLEALDFMSYEDLLRLSDYNTLIAAKVSLSIYRRATRLIEFFLQGRANFDVPSSQT